MRRAEEKMRASERRSMHMGVAAGRWSTSGDRPIPPTPPRNEQVSDEERLTILRMLQRRRSPVKKPRNSLPRSRANRQPATGPVTGERHV
jgi:hypothetical protein